MPPTRNIVVMGASAVGLDLEQALKKVLPARAPFSNLPVVIDGVSGAPEKMFLNARQIVGSAGHSPLILVSLHREKIDLR